MKKVTRCVLTIEDLRENSERRPDSHCWHYLGALDKQGCPRIYTFDHKRIEKRLMGPATAVFNIARGSSPHPLVPYRWCWTADCVHPGHIALAGSQGDLMRRLGAAGRLSGPKAVTRAHLDQAASVFGATVTPDDVALQALQSTETGVATAKRLGISQQVVSRIRRGESHKWLAREECAP
jgi:hypothetical protein